MVRLAVDETTTPLKRRKGTILTPFRKIFAIICLSPVFTVFYNADMAGTLHGVVVIE
jgi:hypothetical protein